MAKSSKEPKISLRLIIDEEKNKVILAEAGKNFVELLYSFLTLPMGTKVRLLEKHQRCRMSSNFSTSLCDCGKLMKDEMSFLEGEKFVGGIENDFDGVLIRERSSFIITVDSTSSLLKTLQDLGCCDVSKLSERVLDISLKEVLTFLQYVFSSNAPLTDTFLKNQKLRNIYRRFSPSLEKNKDEAEPDKVITFDAIVRKQDMKIMFVECGEDFVNLLFTFLAIPLDSTWEISNSSNNITLGCVGNLCKSFKDLSGNDNIKCLLPYYYGFPDQLLDMAATKPRAYVTYTHSKKLSYFESFSLTAKRTSTSERMTVVDPKSDCGSKNSIGFVKRDTKFIVSDDLTVTPKNSSSTFSVLKKLQIHTKDLEVQVISISKAEEFDCMESTKGRR
ncbi:unnamed protein product [Arabis nemorensis]|uniref:DUF674 family protein n=1 Tax=Arabis nemorensis TaxID=586526 RepID=A0A565CGX1_9BRAS|nr:unnamed protein product [Arabis nemorensis]